MNSNYVRLVGMKIKKYLLQSFFLKKNYGCILNFTNMYDFFKIFQN